MKKRLKSGFISGLIALMAMLLMPVALAETQQSTDVVFMISPDTFQYDTQTASTNTFQKTVKDNQDVRKEALQEFQQMVSTLRANKIRVIVIPSKKDIITPDAVFPNNWFSVHKMGDNETVLVLYPMLVPNRQAERQVSAVEDALKSEHIVITRVLDLTSFEKQNKALEGTGSLVLDRVNHIAYASLSPRTNPDVLKQFAQDLHYKTITFHSYDKNNTLIYHTNVMLSVGTKFAVICVDTIRDPQERHHVLETLSETNKNIIKITPKQMENMAGNILEVKGTDNQTKIVMSQSAYDAFTPAQRQQLKDYGSLVIVNIPVIEKVGGGSARCMLAEIFY